MSIELSDAPPVSKLPFLLLSLIYYTAVVRLGSTLWIKFFFCVLEVATYDCSLLIHPVSSSVFCSAAQSGCTASPASPDNTSISVVARRFSVSRSSVWRGWRRYLETGLYMRNAWQGRKRTLTQQQQDWCLGTARALHNDPQLATGVHDLSVRDKLHEVIVESVHVDRREHLSVATTCKTVLLSEFVLLLPLHCTCRYFHIRQIRWKWSRITFASQARQIDIPKVQQTWYYTATI